VEFVRCKECTNKFHGHYKCSKCHEDFGQSWPTWLTPDCTEKEFKFCPMCGKKFTDTRPR